MRFFRPTSCCIGICISIFLLWLILRIGRRSSSLGSQFNSTEASSVINQLCADFRAGYLSGDLCNRLCHYSNSTVLDFQPENKVIFVLKLGGQKLVLKSDSPRFHTYEQLSDTLSQKEFFEKVREVVNYQLQIGFPADYTHHLIEHIWPSLKRNDDLTVIDRHSLWSLVQQDEYLVFQLLKLSRLFPQVLGTCGNFYAVDYAIPLKLNSYYYTTLRSKILLHISGTLKLLYDFLNEPLHWCDVKFENLGLHPDFPKRFLVLDGDMMFTESGLNALLSRLRCNSDADCKFFDCAAMCDTKAQRCSGRTNDNIEVFCSKLVYELYGGFWSKNNKLLEVCHKIKDMNHTERLTWLHQAWAWSMADV